MIGDNLAPRQVDRAEYAAICRYLEIEPRPHLYAHLVRYLSSVRIPRGAEGSLARHLEAKRLTPWRVARLDLATKLFMRGHPLRYVLNAVIALHECDGEGYLDLAGRCSSRKPVAAAAAWSLGFVVNLAITMPWLAWQVLAFLPSRSAPDRAKLTGRRVLITGASRGLGKDLLLCCLEDGAEVIGVVRSAESAARLTAELPATASVRLLVADLSRAGALQVALDEARIARDSVAMAIACAGVKRDGQSVLALEGLRETFQVNLFSAVELARWLCGRVDGTERPAAVGPGESEMTPIAHADASVHPPAAGGRGSVMSSTASLVLISSMGRWHGMDFSCGYNASKAALSIWGESLDMERQLAGGRRVAVTVAEPGLFASDMTRQTPAARWLFAQRRRVARRILDGAMAGRRAIRPPFWFALLTWGVCAAGRGFRYHFLAGAKARDDGR